MEGQGENAHQDVSTPSPGGGFSGLASPLSALSFLRDVSPPPPGRLLAVSKRPPGWQLCDTDATREIICVGPAGHPYVTPGPGLPSRLLASVLRDGLSPEPSPPCLL